MAKKQIRKAKEKTSRWDAVDYLKSHDDMVEYLAVAMEEAGDDAAYIAAVIGDIVRAHGNMQQLARKTGISRQGLYKALARDGNPSFETILKVTHALGFELVPRAAKAA
jgi:probable addiction module antidote protein